MPQRRRLEQHEGKLSPPPALPETISCVTREKHCLCKRSILLLDFAPIQMESRDNVPLLEGMVNDFEFAPCGDW